MACCSEHSRADLLRRSLAQAGQGLPAIEPGMPLPAGTGLTRRSLLMRSLGLGLAVYGGGSLLPRAVEEGIAAATASGPGRVLVSVFLDGGADSLSMLFPGTDPLYRQYRPRLGLDPSQATPFSEDGRLFWHPALASMAALHAEGKVSVMPGIGYTDPNQSHFTSRHYWEVGALDNRLATGWLGRYIDRVGNPDNPLQGLSLDWSLQPAIATAKLPVASVDSPDRYDFWARGVWGEVHDAMIAGIEDLGSAGTGGDPGLEQATFAARQSVQLYRQLRPFRPKEGAPEGPAAFGPKAPYPDGDDPFPRRLAGLASMLAAGLPLKVVALSAPGAYDTHDNQPQDLADGLQLTADSLLAFQRDLEARGLADRVLVHVWSEFGRRAKENGSNGTDHGAGGAGFLIGTRVSGSMLGEFPGLGSLDPDGNLRSTLDFRAVYGSILDQWLGADPAAIIPGVEKLALPKILR